MIDERPSVPLQANMVTKVDLWRFPKDRARDRGTGKEEVQKSKETPGVERGGHGGQWSDVVLVWMVGVFWRGGEPAVTKCRIIAV